MKLREKKTVLVFDFGGESLDVSIVEVTDWSARVIGLTSEAIGGRAFDEKLTDFCLNEINSLHWIDLRKDQNGRYLISGQDFELTLTREQFEEQNEEVFNRILNPVERVLKTTGRKVGDIEEVLLVGGSSLIPKVQQKLTEFFNRKPIAPVNPEEAVVLGASFLAQRIVEGRDFVEAMAFGAEAMSQQQASDGFSRSSAAMEQKAKGGRSKRKAAPASSGSESVRNSTLIERPGQAISQKELISKLSF
jgi:molecular chaperone DnaK (HSP70)